MSETSNSLHDKINRLGDTPTVAKLTVSVTLSGPTAIEVRRVCDNLDIGTSTFLKRAIKGELRSMGIVVE